MKILIIGSKGFIGHHLVLYFNMMSHEVYTCDIIDDITTINYIKVDRNFPDYQNLFVQNNYDLCINCSGAASVSNSFDNTIYDFELNSLNVIKILEGIRLYNRCCKFMNISSAAVYGNPKILPIAEVSELAPISPYGYHKLIAEAVLDEYNLLWGIKTCSARIFSAYGNGLKRQIIYDISKKIIFSDEVRLFGTGNETRDFIHINDICKAIDCIITHDNFNSTKINIANGKQVSIKDIVQIFNTFWSHDKKIIFDGVKRNGDPVNWCADISLLKSFGYIQSISIYDGVKRYINWIKEEKLE